MERNSESHTQVNLNLSEAFIFGRVKVLFYTDRLLFQSFFFSGVVSNVPANSRAPQVLFHYTSAAIIFLELIWF